LFSIYFAEDFPSAYRVTNILNCLENVDYNVSTEEQKEVYAFMAVCLMRAGSREYSKMWASGKAENIYDHVMPAEFCIALMYFDVYGDEFLGHKRESEKKTGGIGRRSNEAKKVELAVFNELTPRVNLLYSPDRREEWAKWDAALTDYKPQQKTKKRDLADFCDDDNKQEEEVFAYDASLLEMDLDGCTEINPV